MRPAALFIVAAIAAAPGVALAQQNNGPTVVQQRLDITGVAPDACVLSTPRSTSVANTTVEPLAGSHTTQVTINQMIDTTTLTALPASVNLSFPLICNGPNRLTVTSARGGMTLPAPAPRAQGFTDHVDYTVQASWAGQTASSSTRTSRNVEINSGAGSTGNVYLSIQIPGGGDRLIAGPYSDTLTLEVQPAT